MVGGFKVVDAHAHLGKCCVFDLSTTEEDLIHRMDEAEWTPRLCNLIQEPRRPPRSTTGLLTCANGVQAVFTAWRVSARTATMTRIEARWNVAWMNFILLDSNFIPSATA